MMYSPHFVAQVTFFAQVQLLLKKNIGISQKQKCLPSEIYFILYSDSPHLQRRIVGIFYLSNYFILYIFACLDNTTLYSLLLEVLL